MRLRKGLLGFLVGLIAIGVVLRRRMQTIESAPILPEPAPPSPEPPRITLPAQVLNAADSVPETSSTNNIPLAIPSEAEEVAAQTAPDNEAEAPLLERAVGEPVQDAPPAEPEEEIDPGDDDEHPIAYCVSCREKQPMLDAHEENLENGRRVLRGTCEVCGSKMVRFLPSKPAA